VDLPITNQTQTQATVQLWPHEWLRLAGSLPAVPPAARIGVITSLRTKIEREVQGARRPVRITFSTDDLRVVEEYARLI